MFLVVFFNVCLWYSAVGRQLKGFEVFRCQLVQPAGIRKVFLEVTLSPKYFGYWWLLFKSLGEGWRLLTIFTLQSVA